MHMMCTRRLTKFGNTNRSLKGERSGYIKQIPDGIFALKQFNVSSLSCPQCLYFTKNKIVQFSSFVQIKNLKKISICLTFLLPMWKPASETLKKSCGMTVKFANTSCWRDLRRIPHAPASFLVRNGSRICFSLFAANNHGVMSIPTF